MFWRFKQVSDNDGRFQGPVYVIVQADTYREANQRAEASNLVNFQNNRWLQKDQFDRKYDVPTIGDTDITSAAIDMFFSGRSYVVVYKDGTIVSGKMP